MTSDFDRRSTSDSLDAADAPPLVRLSDLGPGERCLVSEVDTDDGAGRRILDLGLLPGTEVRVVRRAPLGDPIEYELIGYRLCLRSSEAARIRVRKLP